MQPLSQAKIEQVLSLAEIRGFFLKRSYAVKLDLAKEIRDELNIHATGEDFLQYLESLKPVKPTAKREKTEMIPTFAGQVKASEADRPIIYGKRFIVTSAQNETAVFAPTG